MRDPGEREDPLTRLLEQHGLGRLAGLLAEHGVDLAVMPQLTDADLRELGLSMGDRKRFATLQASLVVASPVAARPKDEAERRQITVVFADLVGSTALSVQLDPEDMRDVVRAYHRAVADAVETYGGYVAQHLGDGAVAYFGWPEARENDAERGVRASLAIVAAVAGLSATMGRPMATRIGVATGRVVVGDVLYNQESVERPVIGETPNLAARLQAVAPENGVVISAATRQMVGGLFDVTDLGELELKGFNRPMRAYRVERENADVGRFRALRGGSLSTFVGRERERESLRRTWDRARQGAGRTVCLVAEGGMGKSRLADWMRVSAAVDGASDQRYDCSPYHGGSAFHPVLRELEASAGILREDDPTTRWTKLAAFVDAAGLTSSTDLPVLAKALQIPIPPGTVVPRLEPIQEKEIVVAAVITRLRHSAQSGPVLVIVEDCHWIDPSSTELFGRLLTEIASLPVLVLLCYRPDFTPPASWFGAEPLEVIELARLTPESCRELVESLVRAGPLSPDVMQQIIARTDGVPLFVEELTRTVLESDSEAIPATLHDSLLARLDRLGDVKHVAQVAACVGREFRRDLLQRVSGLDEPMLDDALSRLLDSSLVWRDSEQDAGRYTFKHALVQDAAYESLLRATRVTLHRQIAVILEGEVAESEPEIIAHHYQRAGVVDKEIDYWLLSGQRALRTSAYLEAIQHLTKGMAALNRLPAADPVRELAMTVHLAVPMTLTQGWAADKVGAAYRRAHELVELLGAPPETFPTLVGVFTYYLVRGNFAHAYELALSNERIAVSSGDRELIMESAHDRGTSALYTGRLDEALPYLLRAAELYDPARDAHHAFLYGKLPGPTANAHLLMIYGLRGNYDEARSAVARSLDDAETGHHAFSRLWVLTGLCVLHVIFGERDEVARVSARLIEESQSLGFPNWLAQGLVWAGWARAVDGEPDAGIAMIRQGLGIWEMTGAELFKPFLMTRLVDALLAADQLDEAEQTYQQVAACMDRTGEVWAAADSHRLGAEIARRQHGDDSDLARTRYGLALAAAGRTGAKLYELAVVADEARAHLRAGRVAEAHTELGPRLDEFAGSEIPIVRQVRELDQSTMVI